MRTEPALVLRRVPEDGKRGRIHPARQGSTYVLCSDGSWRKARVIGWARCGGGGGWAVLLRQGMSEAAWYLHDHRALHPA